MKKTIISWDLGATKCAVGVVDYHEDSQQFFCRKQHSLKLTECQSLDDLVNQFEKNLDISMSDADAICIGAAGQYDGHCVQLQAGYPYPMVFGEISTARRWPSMAVVHDYVPVVCSTFTSYMNEPNNVKYLNSQKIPLHGRRVALGIGTGLGLKDGVMFSNGDFWLGQNEIGHIGIVTPPHAKSEERARHRELMRFLMSEKKLLPGETLTFEKILTGKGMVNLFQFVHNAHEHFSPEEIGQKIKNGESPETLDLFAWYLGLFVGTAQLIFMPESGIWMTGGVLLKHLEAVDRPAFSQGISASPAYSASREQLPLGVLCNDQHAFMGAAFYAVNRLIP